MKNAINNSLSTIFFLPQEQFARFESLARMLADATFGVPERYRGNIGDCFNAVDTAYRMGVSPLQVMQNTREVGGKLLWTYQFVKALIEASGKIQGDLRYQEEGDRADEKTYRVRAVATAADGGTLEGPWITWQMATLEGWTDSTKYISMPEVMFRARATTFFGNLYFTGLLMGVRIDDGVQVGEAATAAAVQTGLAEPGIVPLLSEPVPAAAPTSVFAAALAKTPLGEVPPQSQKAAEPPPKEGEPAPEAVAAVAQKPARRSRRGGAAEAGELSQRTEQTLRTAGAERERVDLAQASTVGAGDQLPTAEDVGADGSASLQVPLIDGATLAPASSTSTADPDAGSDAATSAGDLAQATGEVEAAQPALQAELLGEQAELSDVSHAQAEDLLPLADVTTAASGAAELSVEDRFSAAFNQVDTLGATKESLSEAMALIDTFGKPERDDLLLIVFGSLIRHLTSFGGDSKPWTAEAIAFVTHVRKVFADTKDQVQGNEELAAKRAAVGSAYRALIERLESRRSTAPAA